MKTKKKRWWRCTSKPRCIPPTAHCYSIEHTDNRLGEQELGSHIYDSPTTHNSHHHNFTRCPSYLRAHTGCPDSSLFTHTVTYSHTRTHTGWRSDDDERARNDANRLFSISSCKGCTCTRSRSCSHGRPRRTPRPSRTRPRGACQRKWWKKISGMEINIDKFRFWVQAP